MTNGMYNTRTTKGGGEPGNGLHAAAKGLLERWSIRDTSTAGRYYDDLQKVASSGGDLKAAIGGLLKKWTSRNPEEDMAGSYYQQLKAAYDKAGGGGEKGEETAKGPRPGSAKAKMNVAAIKRQVAAIKVLDRDSKAVSTGRPRPKSRMTDYVSPEVAAKVFEGWEEGQWQRTGYPDTATGRARHQKHEAEQKVWQQSPEGKASELAVKIAKWKEAAKKRDQFNADAKAERDAGKKGQ